MRGSGGVMCSYVPVQDSLVDSPNTLFQLPLVGIICEISCSSR